MVIFCERYPKFRYCLDMTIQFGNSSMQEAFTRNELNELRNQLESVIEDIDYLLEFEDDSQNQTTAP